MARKVVYTAQLDAASFKRNADQIVKIYQRTLSRIDVQVVDPGQTRQAAREIGRITAEYRDLEAISKRVNREAVELAKNLSRARVPAVAAGGAGATGGLGSLLGKGGGGALLGKVAGTLAGGFVGGLAVDAIRRQASELKALGEEITRSGEQFEFLVGNAGKAEAILRAVTNATDGSATKFDAQKLSAQALNAELAKTPKEFDELVRAARAAEQISPFVADIGQAIARIEATSSSQSFDGLKLLGVAADDVRERMERLQRVNARLTDEQAFAAATIDTLNEKHGQLVTTVEAQASGYELLTTRVRALKEEAALLADDYIDLPDVVDKAFARLSFEFGGNLPLERLRAIIEEDANSPVQAGLSFVGLDRIEGLQAALGSLDRFLELQQEIGSENPQIQRIEDVFESLATQIARTGAVTDGQLESFQQLDATMANVAAAGGAYAQSGEEIAAAEQAAADAAKAADAAYIQQIQTMDRASLTALSLGGNMNTLESDTEALTARVATLNAQLGAIGGAESGITNRIISEAANVAAIVGDDAARAIAQTALDVVESRFDDIENNLIAGGNGPSALDLALETARVSDVVLAPFAAIEEQRKAQEQAEKDALREFQRLQKQGLAEVQRLEKARIADLNAAVQSTAGLFDTSQVSAQDFELQELGLRGDAADEFLRRLRAGLNGEDLFPDLSIDEAFEKARLGLERVGAEVGIGTPEAIVKAFDAAWNDSSLFASLENVDQFINPEAVQRSVELSAKAKEGEQNLLARFGIDASSDLGVGSAIQADIQRSEIDVALREKIALGVTANEEQDLNQVALLAISEAAAGAAVAPQLLVDPKELASLTSELQMSFAAQAQSVDILQPVLGNLRADLNSQATQGVLINGGRQFWDHFERGVIQGARGSALVDNITTIVLENVRDSLSDGAQAQ